MKREMFYEAARQGQLNLNIPADIIQSQWQNNKILNHKVLNLEKYHICSSLSFERL